MQGAQPPGAAWSRQLWFVVAALTAMGLIGTGLLLVALLGWIHGGCGGGAVILLAVWLGLAVAIVFIGGVAGTGLVLFWLRNRWGPLVLIVSNAMATGFIGWIGGIPAPLLWVVLPLAAAPVVAIGLLVWPLLTRGRTRVKVVELVVLGLLALPFVWLYVAGMPQEIQSALGPPPAPVASIRCGGA